MQFFWCLLLSVIFVVQSANAQNVPVYNSTLSTGNTERISVYNSSKNSASAKPLSIKGMLRGQSQSDGYSRNSVSTYNLGSKKNRRQSLLSMTPAQIRAKQVEDKRTAEKRAAEARKKRAKLQEERSFKEEANSYRNRFKASDDSIETSYSVMPQEQKKRTVILKDNKYSVPKPVFNSVY